MKWIAIETQKPKPNEYVMLCHNEDLWVVIGSRMYGKYWNQFEDPDVDCQIYPTHWAPIPKPARKITM